MGSGFPNPLLHVDTRLNTAWNLFVKLRLRVLRCAVGGGGTVLATGTAGASVRSSDGPDVLTPLQTNSTKDRATHGRLQILYTLRSFDKCPYVRHQHSNWAL